MRSMFLAWAILLSVPMLCAQSPPPIKSLSIGDSAPDLIFGQVINYKETSAKLSDFKGKLLILDFWTTSCSVCIKQFGTMNELQLKYGDSLQIMMVNPSLSGNRKEKIEAVFQRWEKKYSTKFILPNSIEDSVFFNYFPFQVIPHYVWIDPNGFVKAITSHEEVNEENIQSAFAGNFSQFELKNDIIGFEKNKSLFFNNKSTENAEIIFSSIISKGIEGLPGSVGFSYNDKNLVDRLFAVNSSIIGLYQLAIPSIENFPRNRLLLQVASTDEYFAEMKNGSLQHTYCYELKMTPGAAHNFKLRLKYELDKIFNLRTKLEKRKVKCFVLKNKGKLNALKSRGEEPADNLYEDDKNNQKYITNQPVSYLINYLNDQLTIPVVDETNISGPIDLKFCIDPHNLKDLKSTLLDNGLELVETVREMDMFIIREKESKNNHQSKNSK